MYYAEDQGFFQRAGINVQIEQMRGGAAIAAAVAAGSLDIGGANPLAIAQARARNIPFVVVAPGAYFESATARQFLVVAKDSPIRSGKDLNGKIIGVSSLGGVDNLAAAAWVDRNGGDLASVKLVEAVPSAMVDELEQGRIAAATLNDPYLTAAGPRVRVLGDCYGAIANRYYQSAWFSTPDSIARKPDAMHRFAEAIAAAGDWSVANPQAAAAVLEKYFKVREAKTTLKFARGLDPAMIQPILDSAYTYKLIPAQVPATTMLWSGK